jgi:hypothetical protein
VCGGKTERERNMYKFLCHQRNLPFVTGVLGQRLNARGFIYQPQLLTPICQIKRWVVVKGKERRLINMAQACRKEAK